MDLSSLNPAQKEAVECLEGPLLVLAGAGSGKTRVLTYRMANLLEHSVRPWNILALTFTNKAAKEMKERASLLIGDKATDMSVTTFHSLCFRILRTESKSIGREKNFAVYDDSDQMKLIGDILKELGVSEKSMPKRQFKEMISNAKNHSTDPEQYIIDTAQDSSDMNIKVYRKYQKRLSLVNAMDFDDLLLETLKLLKNDKTVLEKYRDKFKYVLVDEYQDTNLIQYEIVELICKEHKNICVVGDDDQSIYGWRGADIRNILEFERDFKGAKVVRLEQNYRSTSYILDAANAVINNNSTRKRKTLWTDKNGGQKIILYSAQNERDESAYVAKTILKEVEGERSYRDFAVLYRMNAQSRVIESTLMNYGIPHSVYGGMRFYERKEIKDILAYLRLCANPADDTALMRIINLPKRAIGDKTIDSIKDEAMKNDLPMFFAATDGIGVPSKATAKVKDFVEMITDFIALSKTMTPSALAEHIISTIEYEKHLYSEDKAGEAETRIENIRELIGNIKEIEADAGPDDDPLSLFLENVALIADIDAMKEETSTVSLMTLHSAKGLEFPVVFLVGMEDNIFPTSRAIFGDGIEEERRLCYVGITRAMEELYMTCAVSRMLFGEASYNRRSRFLNEVPAELFEDNSVVKPVAQPVQHAQQPATHHKHQSYMESKYASGLGFGRSDVSKLSGETVSKTADTGGFKQFQKVRHDKYGDGTITELSGSGSAMTITIDFGGIGIKKFAAAYAPIKILNSEN